MDLSENYSNLANAIVMRAVTDCVQFGLEYFKNPFGMSAPNRRDWKDAKDFLLSPDRLSVFTELDGGVLYKEAEAQLKNEIQRYLKRRIHLQLFKTNKKGGTKCQQSPMQQRERTRT